jgi:hypothetical protein
VEEGRGLLDGDERKEDIELHEGKCGNAPERRTENGMNNTNMEDKVVNPEGQALQMVHEPTVNGSSSS